MQHKLSIAGAGTMGSGIALSAAAHGIPVILYDLNAELVAGATARIEKDLQAQVERKKMTQEEKEAVMNRIHFTSSPGDCKSSVIIEAIVEKMAAKVALFRELEKRNDPRTIFATNTSSLSVTDIAEQCGFPERVVGMHFFNPANRMKLVEIVETKYLSASVVGQIQSLAAAMGKTSVICQDAPGFIVNRVARPYYLEALRLAQQGAANMETIDRLTEAAGFKMGPFHLMDLIGNDINYAVSCSLYEALGKPERLKPAALQESKVREGKLGRKTGSGFFDYGRGK